MKRCPQCNRVETDDALVFCRADGTALISDSASLDRDERTARFGSASLASEIETSILPHATDADLSRPTAPTAMLPPQHAPGPTRERSGRKVSKAVAIALAAVFIAAIVISVYFYFSRKTNAAI